MSDPDPTQLNAAQVEAVAHKNGPLLVVAGPGSGKTRVMTHRIARLIAEGVPPLAILAITFTNKAAQEMLDRTLALLPAEAKDRGEIPIISTFHSFCARTLRRWISQLEPYHSSFTIYDTEDQRRLVEEVLDDLELERSTFAPAMCLSRISRMKNDMVSAEEAFDAAVTHRSRKIAHVYRNYQSALAARNALDFDDLLLVTLRLLREFESVRESCRYLHRYILIDEFQDTNRPQYLTARLLAEEHRNLCITGDPDQSIYSWRGASPENFDRFAEDFPERTVVLLDQNYRSTPEIINAAARLTGSAVGHRSFFTRNSSGDPVEIRGVPTEKSEAGTIATAVSAWQAQGTPLAEIAVLYRVNALSRNIEEEFVRQRIPYVVIAGMSFYQRKEIKDIVCYLRATFLPRDEVAFRRVVNTPNRGVGKVTLDRLEDAARAAGLSLGEALRSPAVIEKIPKRSRGGLLEFRAILDELRALEGRPLTEQIYAAIERSSYLPYLERTEPETWRDRELNLEELMTAGSETELLLAQSPPVNGQRPDPLTTFLERIALVTDIDKWEQRRDRVALMTLHAAKGLEFDRVVVAGVEEALLPHARRNDDEDSEDSEEEERRLLYVGVTRARDSVLLLYTGWRRRFGEREPRVASRFLKELRGDGVVWEDEVLLTTPPSSFRASASREEYMDETFDEHSELIPGVHIEHDLLGRGVITAASGFGESKRVTVRFREHGEKQFLVSHTPFRIVGDSDSW